MSNEPIQRFTREDGTFEELKSGPFLEKITEVVASVMYVFNVQTMSNEYVNREVGAILGYSPEEIQQMGEEYVPITTHPDDLAKMFDHFTSLGTLEDGQVTTNEYRMRNRDGNYQTFLSRDIVMDRDETGAVLRIAGVSVDITDYKASEAKAEAAIDAADRANEDLRAFTYSVSHELRSPAITVQMVLNELRDGHAGPLTDEASGLIDQALDTIKRMQGTITTVLDFNRMVGSEPVRTGVDLTEVTQDILRERAAEIAAAPAEITVAHLPRVTADPEQIRILLSNLIDNAIKYKKPGETARLDISATYPGATRETVELSFVDQGIGLDPDYGEKIFQMFWRGHTQRKITGTGLGLSLCQRIAKAHGGSVRATSDGTSGSTFTLTLPTGNADPAPEA